ncbi:MAG: hypothetical protein R2911_18035 [Caldilineaceae bacterium]
MTFPTLPAFPYGAVYFRKSNPPQADWARDYGVAAEDGMNIFRHWFLWSAIEIAPGVLIGATTTVNWTSRGQRYYDHYRRI